MDILYYYYTKSLEVVISWKLVVIWNLKPQQWTFHTQVMGLSCTFDPLPIDDFVTSVAYLENIGSLSCTDLINVHISFYDIGESCMLISPPISEKS